VHLLLTKSNQAALAGQVVTQALAGLIEEKVMGFDVQLNTQEWDC
jgi:hypothetical protein